MKTINFKIIYAKNENVYEEGYVEVPEDIEEFPEYFYYNQSGLTQPTRFIHHDEIGITQIGATSEQLAEIDEFKNECYNYIDFITEVIETAEDENRTFVKGDLIITINNGAEFTVSFEDYNNPDWDSQYYIAATLMFNNNKVTLDNEIYFEDPYTYDEYKVGSDVIYENGAYVIEFPKSYWDEDVDENEKKEIITYYTDAFRKAYAQSISKNLAIYSKYGNNVEQSFEDCDINEIALVTDDNLDDFLRSEGIIK